jgi:hypothetical protein
MKKRSTHIENGLIIIESESTNIESVRRQAAYGQAAPWWQRFNLRDGVVRNRKEGTRGLEIPSCHEVP